MALEWSNIAFIAYFVLNLILIIVVTIKARSEALQPTPPKDIDQLDHETEIDPDRKETKPNSPPTQPNDDIELDQENAIDGDPKETSPDANRLSMKQLFKVVWTKRAIYAPLLVHLYDTSTDIGVIVEWWILAEEPNNDLNDAINMTIIIWLSIGFLIFYRLAAFRMLVHTKNSGIEIAKDNDDEDEHNLCVVFLLCVFDLYIIKTIYKSIKNKDTEAGPRQKLLQLLESMFESLPQMVLQSVFLIKTQTIETSSTSIVAVSLVASLLSITNKYVWFDTDSVRSHAKTLDIQKDCGCCVNYAYIARIIWRLSLISIRFIIFSMVWCVIGGMYWFIFANFSWVIWLSYFYIARKLAFIRGDHEYDFVKARNTRPLLYALVASFVSYLLSKDNAHWLFVVHFIETSVAMSFITWFILSPVTCWRCTDPSERTMDNPLISLYLISGWSLFGLQVILFPLVRTMIKDGAKEED
eukprot:241641_1